MSENTVTTEEHVEVEEQGIEEELVTTPSALAKEAGVPPQMIYSYLQAGRIEGFEGQIKGRSRTQKLILVEDAEKWLEQYRERKEAREAAHVEELAAQLDVEA